MTNFRKWFLFISAILMIIGGFTLTVGIEVPMDVENWLYLIGGIISILIGVLILMKLEKFDQKI